MAEETKTKNSKKGLVDFLNTNSKKFIIVAVALAGLALAGLAVLWWMNKDVIAKVGDTKITQSEFDRAKEIGKNQANSTKNKKYSDSEFIKKGLIERKLVDKIALDNNINVGGDEIQEVIQDLKKYSLTYGMNDKEISDFARYLALRYKIIQVLTDNRTGQFINVYYKQGNGIEKIAGVTTENLKSWANEKAEAIKQNIGTNTEKYTEIYNEMRNNKTPYDSKAYYAGQFPNITRENQVFNQEIRDVTFKLNVGEISNVLDNDNEKTFTVIYLVAKNRRYSSYQAILDEYQKYVSFNSKNFLKTNIFADLKSLLVGKTFACKESPCNGGGACCVLACTGSNAVCQWMVASVAVDLPNCKTHGAKCNTGGDDDDDDDGCTPINGSNASARCGSAINSDWNNKPDSGLCSSGSAGSVTKTSNGDFWKWTCTDTNYGSCGGSTDTDTASCKAPASYKLSVELTGCGGESGTVRVKDISPPGRNNNTPADHKIFCDWNHKTAAACSGKYTKDKVDLYEEPGNDNVFLGWFKSWLTPSDRGIDETTPVELIKQDRNVTARFGFTETVVLSGNGTGTVTGVTTAGTPNINCSNISGAETKCSDKLAQMGDKDSGNITLTATPNPGDGSSFVQWQNCPKEDANVCKFPKNNTFCKNRTITAVFNKPCTNNQLPAVSIEVPLYNPNPDLWAKYNTSDLVKPTARITDVCDKVKITEFSTIKVAKTLEDWKNNNLLTGELWTNKTVAMDYGFSPQSNPELSLGSYSPGIYEIIAYGRSDNQDPVQYSSPSFFVVTSGAITKSCISATPAKGTVPLTVKISYMGIDNAQIDPIGDGANWFTGTNPFYYTYNYKSDDTEKTFKPTIRDMSVSPPVIYKCNDVNPKKKTSDTGGEVSP